GLSISGGAECKAHPHIIVDKISANSAAASEGQLKAGMKLLSIDGRSLKGVSHKMAVSIIKSSFVNKKDRWMQIAASE
ncbi:hypothetical protein HELRODRAFT_67826, partial [Helobdella robusta]|uniref:PDZ domain-containing protein n=1 Tax=Helobdella robusta TaxID=6412 RepID=T1FZ59_HELRO